MGFSVKSKSTLTVVVLTRNNVAKSAAVALEKKEKNVVLCFILEGECQRVDAMENPNKKKIEN